jgi:hypothetical protein
MYVVELEYKIWLTAGEGDPPRTTRIEYAQKFESLAKAERALKKARKFRTFCRAHIQKVS